MLKVGIAGLGFMGRRHYEIYHSMPPNTVTVAAIAEPDAEKRSGDWSRTTGNIGDPGHMQDITGIKTYSSIAALMEDPEIDLVDITLPSFMHRDAAIAAFAAGKHVICEKPLSLKFQECQDILDAAKKYNRQLYVGHCLRFWPAYARAVEIIKCEDLGKTLTAKLTRYTAKPQWGWYSDETNQDLTGGAALDLHIHDADFIVYLYGRPKAVTSFTGGRSGKDSLDHISTFYHYDNDCFISAEAAWEYSTGRPFSMTFDFQMEKGTLSLADDGSLTIYRDGRTPEELEVPPGDGWSYELIHFTSCAAIGKPSSIISSEDAAFAVKLVRHEIESARIGKRVEIT